MLFNLIFWRMNLQEELVRTDRKRQQIFSRQLSLSVVTEWLQKEGELELEALQRMGLSQNEISQEQRNWITQCQLNQMYCGEVYHIDDIRKICMEYNMRMLPSRLYRGPVDPTFGVKVKHFQKDHQLTQEQTEEGFFIVAPAKTFELEKRQRPVIDVDPLLLYKVNDHFYKLVHQWGSDLNIFRFVSAWRHRNLAQMTFHWMFMSFMFTMLLLGLFVENLVNAVIVASVVSSFIGWMYYSSLYDRPDELKHLFSRYNWNQIWTY